MPERTPDELAALIKIRTATTTYVARVDNQLVLVAGKPPTALVGKFEGRVGTTTRSRKGRTSRKPNGSRQFIKPYNDFVEVVMY